MKGEQFTTWDIVNRMGIKRERLREWLQRGYIVPSIQEAEGAGTKNLFSRWDLYTIKLFTYLLSRGYSRESGGQLISSLIGEKGRREWLTRSGWDPGKSFKYLVAKTLILGKNRIVHWIPYGDTTSSISVEDRFDDMLVINFEKIRKAVDSQID